ncbi:MAG: flagellar filament capping protein FliD [Enterobacter sp.]|jgi:flagellar hook-associated protein 2|nr:flagellar filament capping protein FliD [Enterobacter sp.]
MASVSTLGIGSGLKLADILDSLTTAEKAQLTPITKQQTSYTAKLSAYGTLKNSLEAFQTANTALNKADLFSSTTTTSSSSAFSATTTGGAIAGKYTISVSQLAQAQTLTTRNTQPDNKTAIASADSKITIQQGGDKKPVTVNISAADSSLTGIRDAINKANAGVSASVINVGNGEYRLSITSTETGSDNAMTLTVSGDADLQSFMGYNGTSTDAGNGMLESVTAQNALLKVNNVDIENSSNTISDALEDITLNLTDTTTGNQTLTITKDTSKAETAMKTWVDAYNTLQDSFASLTKYTKVDVGTDSQDTSNGALIGDSTLRTIQTQLKSMLSNTTGGTDFKTLSQVGITTDPMTGKLELDSTKLKKTLTENPTAVKDLVVGDGKKTGITTTMSSNLTNWLSSKGIIQAAKDGVSKTLNSLTEDYNNTSTRIDNIVAQYKAQFTKLDVMMSKLNTTSDYLTQQFASTTTKS